jgi:CRISPR/Cas system-associated exonuclease Cas4 (RecB family)
MGESVFINQKTEIKEVSIYELRNLQGSLKLFSEEAYNKIKGRILEVGFKYLFYYWQDKEHKYIIDGHHRQKTLLKMKEEGISIPEYYPAIEIDAKDKKEAAKELLFLNSNYGEMTHQGLKEFINSFELNTIELKNIEIKPLNANINDIINNVEFFPEDDNTSLDEIKGKECPNCGYKL